MHLKHSSCLIWWFSLLTCPLSVLCLWLVIRWSGRNHREKIGVHVSFDQLLNMEPYCCRDPSPKGSPCSSPAPAGSPSPKHFLYELSAVVMHHGKGFGSGHYTAYCYNKEGSKNISLTHKIHFYVKDYKYKGDTHNLLLIHFLGIDLHLIPFLSSPSPSVRVLGPL